MRLFLSVAVVGLGLASLTPQATGQEVYMDFMRPSHTPDLGEYFTQMPKDTPYVGPAETAPWIKYVNPQHAPGSGVGSLFGTLFVIVNPVIGTENVGFYNDSNVSLKLDLFTGTDRRPVSLGAKEILTVQYPVEQDLTAVIGTNDKDFKIELSRGTLYRVHSEGDQYVLSLVPKP